MATVLIDSDGKDILTSGSFITFDKNECRFRLEDLVIKFSFFTDSSKAVSTDFKVDGKTLKISLYNFDNSLGTGTSSPVEIGFLNNRKLYLSFYVSAMSSGCKVVTYTFFQGEEVNDKTK